MTDYFSAISRAILEDNDDLCIKILFFLECQRVFDRLLAIIEWRFRIRVNGDFVYEYNTNKVLSTNEMISFLSNFSVDVCWCGHRFFNNFGLIWDENHQRPIDSPEQQSEYSLEERGIRQKYAIFLENKCN